MWYIHKVTIGKHSYCLLFTSNERSSFSCFSFISSCTHYNRVSIAYVTSLRTKKVHYRDDIYSQMDVTYTQICISATSICFFLSFPIHKYIIVHLFLYSVAVVHLYIYVCICVLQKTECVRATIPTSNVWTSFCFLIISSCIHILNNRWTQHT